MISKKLKLKVKREICNPEGTYIILHTVIDGQECLLVNICAPSVDDMSFFEKCLADVDLLQGRIQDLIRGEPQIVTGLNWRWCAAVSCERSEPFSAWGLGPALGPRKLLGISLLNMHSLHFGVPFYTIFEIIKY